MFHLRFLSVLFSDSKVIRITFKNLSISPRMPLHDLIQRDPFGEKLITITAENLNQTQISNFLQRMHQYETPGTLKDQILPILIHNSL